MSTHTGVEWAVRCEGSEALRSIMAAEVRYDAEVRENFSFQRSFPSIEISTARFAGEA